MVEIKYSTEEFSAIEPNWVYSRQGSIEDEKKSIDFQGVLTLRRYTTPIEEDVVKYLQRKAIELPARKRLILPGQDGKEIRNLNDLLGTLPEEVIAGIASGHPQFLQLVRRTTGAMPLKDGEVPAAYIFARYGLVPNKVIEGNRNARNIDSPDWYDTALSNEGLRDSGLGLQWTLKLRYEQGLPLKEEIDILLKHGTHGSKTMEISMGNYDPAEVSPVVDFLYQDFSESDKIQGLRDDSQTALEERVLESVMGLHRFVQMQVEDAKGHQ